MSEIDVAACATMRKYVERGHKLSARDALLLIDALEKAQSGEPLGIPKNAFIVSFHDEGGRYLGDMSANFLRSHLRADPAERRLKS